MEDQRPAYAVLRWIVLLPTAIVAAWVAWMIFTVVNRITIGMQGVNPDSFLVRVFIEFSSHAAMGAAFVYVGTRIAPRHQKRVAFTLAGLGLVLTGFMLFPAIAVANYWAIWGAIALLAGLGLTALGISEEEIEC